MHVVEGYKVSGIEAVKHGYTWYTILAILSNVIFDNKYVYGYRPQRLRDVGGKLK